MTTNETDNGFRNHETFLVHMDIHNNNGLPYLQRWKERACFHMNSKADNPHAELAREIQNEYGMQAIKWIKSAVPTKGMIPRSIVEDLLASALGRVDWIELAEQLCAE